MRNYLIIGASSGIGKALAQDLSNKGHQVFGTYHQNAMEDQDSIQYYPLDVTQEISLDFIPDQLDGLVFCPGAINLKPFKRISTQAFSEDFELQVLGAIKVIKAALPALQNSETAAIVLFSTVAVQSGFNFHSQVSVSKGAIEGLTKSLAAEFAPKIRVNAIAPSLTDTPLAARLLNTEQKKIANAERHPLKRIGSAMDIAQAAAFLISPASSWITGQIIHVDGGMSTIKS